MNNSRGGNQKLDASLNTGGYVWARYNFMAYKKGEVMKLIARAKDKLKPQEALQVKNIIEDFYSSNPDNAHFPIRRLSDEEYGKKLLLGSEYSIILDLNNYNQIQLFERYLNN